MTVTEFNICVDNYADGLYRFLLKNMKDSDKANDVVQDTYEKLWQGISKIEFINVKSYMFSMAYYLMIKELRHSSNEIELEIGENSEPIHTEQYSDLKETLDAAVQRLPEKQRSAIMLRDYEGYSYEDIAKIMGIETVLVRKYIFRARIALKKHLVSIDNVI
jgi:RNA polymerase sigma-70 factor (ECF subfamily)